MKKKLVRILSILLCFCLIFEQSAFAQVAAELNITGHLSSLYGSIFPDKFRPLHLRYLSYDNLNNQFKLLLDKGDTKNPKETELENTAKILLNYFFIGLTLPSSSFWVNLRPDSPENIIDPLLAQTDVGRILLEADVQLKKDTAQATSPQSPEGRDYWDKLYKKAGELYGSENVTIPTLTRPWIVPDEIIIRETSSQGQSPAGTVPEAPSAYIYKATLKVMLESDYLKSGIARSEATKQSPYAFKDERSRALNEYSTQLIKELIIPNLAKEIN
ncbi:MAG: hypothetical protein WC355_04120, partial [Candidatus Omnitrophota bacterium]